MLVINFISGREKFASVPSVGGVVSSEGGRGVADAPVDAAEAKEEEKVKEKKSHDSPLASKAWGAFYYLMEQN